MKDKCCSCHKHSHRHNHKGNERSLTIILLAISASLLVINLLLGEKLGSIPRLILCLTAFAVAGYKVVFNGIKNIIGLDIKNIFNEEFLMTLASIGAFALKEYNEAVVIMLFYQIGELFTDYAQDKSRDSISSLMNIRPDSANLVTPDGIKVVTPDEVKIGERIMVKPGEKIPLDGKILAGDSYIDTSALTGESTPRYYKVGDMVMSGCINNTKLLEIQVTATYEKSTVAKILELIENADNGTSKSEKFINKFSRIYTPFVVLAAVIIGIVLPLIIGSDFAPWLNKALMFLVISCPCALVISVPLAFFGGIGGASQRGILIKSSESLEKLAGIRSLALDKTGTLTQGSFTVNGIECTQGFTRQELLFAAAHAEMSSSHPIARAIVNYYSKNNSLDESSIVSCEEIAGFGVKAELNIDNSLVTVHLGNSKLMNSLELATLQEDCIFVAINGKLAGTILVNDAIKSVAKPTLDSLNNLHINPIMLTGDTERNADLTANSLDIDYRAGLLPKDKVECIEELKKIGTVAFVGDGINDAPSLAIADIGIAMGGIGSDAAIEASDVVIMDDNLEHIVTAIRISRKTISIAKQNIAVSLFVKALIMGLTALGIVGMYFAVFADVGVSLIAVLNSLRTLRFK